MLADELGEADELGAQRDRRALPSCMRSAASAPQRRWLSKTAAASWGKADLSASSTALMRWVILAKSAYSMPRSVRVGAAAA
jgi:hypothetical protein